MEDSYDPNEGSINGGTPKQIVYFKENPIQKWMMTGGTPMTQETSLWRLIYFNTGGIYDLRGDLLYQLYLTNSI